MDVFDQVRDYEDGLLTFEQTVKFFQYLIDSGLLSHLGSSYEAIAENLVNNGQCQQ